MGSGGFEMGWVLVWSFEQREALWRTSDGCAAYIYIYIYLWATHVAPLLVLRRSTSLRRVRFRTSSNKIYFLSETGEFSFRDDGDLNKGKSMVVKPPNKIDRRWTAPWAKSKTQNYIEKLIRGSSFDWKFSGEAGRVIHNYD